MCKILLNSAGTFNSSDYPPPPPPTPLLMYRALLQPSPLLNAQVFNCEEAGGPVASTVIQHPLDLSPFSLKGIGTFESCVAHIPMGHAWPKWMHVPDLTNEVRGPCCKLRTNFSPVPLIYGPSVKCAGHKSTGKTRICNLQWLRLERIKSVNSRLIWLFLSVHCRSNRSTNQLHVSKFPLISGVHYSLIQNSL